MQTYIIKAKGGIPLKNMFPEIKKNFGFGCMRMKTKDGEVDYDEFRQMIDTFLESGFNYFDTARIYYDGKSEIALRECLTSRYPRDSFVLTDKLSPNSFQCREDIEPFFNSQLEACGVEYFDFYLMHTQTSRNYDHYKSNGAYEEAFRLKKEGKIRHVGISFHDSAEFLDKLLTENPGVEVVQLQFNYVDYEDDRVQSRLCYEVCVKHGKPVLVMEPVKGGQLVNMPAPAGKVLDDLGGGSRASYAIRFAASFPNVIMVLSGMQDMPMVLDNVSYMKDFLPLDEREMEAVQKVAAIYRGEEQIPCTGCRYCVDDCPQQILIPDLFAAVNTGKNEGKTADLTRIPGGKAADCVRCGKCEENCPQFLPIRTLLRRLAQKEI